MGSISKTEPVDQLLSDLTQVKIKPLWAQMTKLNLAAPNPRAIPHVWQYEQIKPLLLRVGDLVSEKLPERRVLMLINPARDAPFTTDTIFGGLQLVMPNGVAPAHRHVAFAMRFIIEGPGGFTAVHCQRITMQ